MIDNNILKPVVLCILDGWGERPAADDNAISLAKTPCWDEVSAKYPKSLLETSGLSVGLPEGQMGNSEVGHMNIGSGRIVMQNLPKIDLAMQDGSLEKAPSLQNMIAQLQSEGGCCHLMGMLSDGGVHSHQNHILYLARIISDQGVLVKLHLFLDGRDVSPKSAESFISSFEDNLAEIKNVQIATIGGRYYAMDRDNKWDRTKAAYDAIVSAKGDREEKAINVVNANYENEIFDEFVKPGVIGDYSGMQDGDAVIMANFRSDRVRQIMSSFVDPEFNGFARDKVIRFSSQIGITSYSDDLDKLLETIFPSDNLTDILAQVLSDNNLKQLHMAETEKYAHVTFFFNGGREEKFSGEDRVLVSSPSVATYDLKPEMSAFEVTDKLVEAICSDKFDFIVVNYANTDMVGHTGNSEAAVKAVEAIDACIERVAKATLDKDGVLFLTADHGNCEQMRDDKTGGPHTSHTTNPVPFVMVTNNADQYNLKNGKLSDIAPTVLKIMNIKKPSAMTGGELL